MALAVKQEGRSGKEKRLDTGILLLVYIIPFIRQRHPAPRSERIAPI